MADELDIAVADKAEVVGLEETFAVAVDPIVGELLAVPSACSIRIALLGLSHMTLIPVDPPVIIGRAKHCLPSGQGETVYRPASLHDAKRPSMQTVVCRRSLASHCESTVKDLYPLLKATAMARLPLAGGITESEGPATFIVEEAVGVEVVTSPPDATES